MPFRYSLQARKSDLRNSGKMTISNTRGAAVCPTRLEYVGTQRYVWFLLFPTANATNCVVEECARERLSSRSLRTSNIKWPRLISSICVVYFRALLCIGLGVCTPL
jgi:hypothetical protein